MLSLIQQNVKSFFIEFSKVIVENLLIPAKQQLLFFTTMRYNRENK